MANELGASTVVGNDGEVYSAMGNARHNGLTPFRFESATTTLPGQIVYVRDIDAGETDAIGFAPFQRQDAEYAVTYEPGVARFSKRRGDLAMDCDVFVPTDFPGDMRLVTLRNLGRRHLSLRVAPFFDIALDEGANESLGKLKAETVGATLLFENPRNDFQRGTAFAADQPRGPDDRDGADALLRRARARHPYAGAGRDRPRRRFAARRRAARRRLRRRGRARAGRGSEDRHRLRPGARPRDGARRRRGGRGRRVERELAATRAAWAERLGRIEVKTNRPDFDRLVNTWLPYQLYASRLFGRVGPNQRGGAIGFRDQLQDVLPLILTEPRLARAQIVLHAGQQFPEGDVLKWWHRAPGGGTGVAQRTRASDPHLWLPYVLARYVRQTGDAGVLDEVAAYLEGPRCPTARTRRWSCRGRRARSATSTSTRAARSNTPCFARGENGLPLLEAGDWNDGIDGLGGKGRGTSVWMGFFFYNVLDGFIPLARLKGDEAFVETCASAREDVRVALESAWWGDHYALDFADDGRVVEIANAMTTGWAAYSGALEFQRALIALEGGLSAIERPDRVLLTATPFFEHRHPIPAASPTTRRACARTAASTATARPGSSTASSSSPRKRATTATLDAARKLAARAFEIFEKISPLKKTDPDRIAAYGLIPIQQPADIYDGYGHGGRGGWSWYTGSAARMMSAAYALLGVSHGRRASERRRRPVRAEGRPGRRIAARRRTRVEAGKARAEARLAAIAQTSLNAIRLSAVATIAVSAGIRSRPSSATTSRESIRRTTPSSPRLPRRSASNNA